MAEVICSRCGHPNSEASNYCSSCGFDLHRSDQEPTTEHVVVTIDESNDGPAATASEAESNLAGATSADTDSDAGQTGQDGADASALEITGNAVFVVKRGGTSGTRYHVTKAFTSIGRHPESDIFLDDVTVSRRHAEIHRDGEAVLLNDAGSLNGTYLNRTRIESGSLRSGDEVQVGKFKLVFLTDDS